MDRKEAADMTPERARRMFQRVLRQWAQDLLCLRSGGLDKPTARHLRMGRVRRGVGGATGVAMPDSGGEQQERAA